MGPMAPSQDPDSSRTAPPPSAEALARVVLRCRELATYLDAHTSLLPQRSESPFLYGQLGDVLQRLQNALRPLSQDDPPVEKSAGFLRRLAGRKVREVPKKSEPRYDLEGNAWTIPVTELVGFLSHSGKSGLLWVTAAPETFVLEFARGSLVHATSNAPPVAYRLGEILLQKQMLEPEELAHLIDQAKAADDLLGGYLVRSGRLKHSDLQRALAFQVQQLFHRLMDAENAFYRFQEGAQLLRSESLEVNITQLLLESARQKDEQRQAADARTRSEPTRPEGLDVLSDAPGAPAPPFPSSVASPSEKATAAREIGTERELSAVTEDQDSPS